MSQQEESAVDSDGAGLATDEKLTAIADDIEEIVAGKADIRVYEVGDDNIEFEVLPEGLGDELEIRHADISTTVHTSFQIVVSRD